MRLLRRQINTLVYCAPTVLVTIGISGTFLFCLLFPVFRRKQNKKKHGEGRGIKRFTLGARLIAGLPYVYFKALLRFPFISTLCSCFWWCFIFRESACRRAWWGRTCRTRYFNPCFPSESIRQNKTRSLCFQKCRCPRSTNLNLKLVSPPKLKTFEVFLVEMPAVQHSKSENTKIFLCSNYRFYFAEVQKASAANIFRSPVNENRRECRDMNHYWYFIRGINTCRDHLDMFLALLIKREAH